MKNYLKLFTVLVAFAGQTVLADCMAHQLTDKSMIGAVEPLGILFPKRDKTLPPPTPLPRLPKQPRVPPR